MWFDFNVWSLSACTQAPNDVEYMENARITAGLMEIDTNLFHRLQQEVTDDRLFTCLKPISDCYAPSQTVPYTRGKVIEQWLEAQGHFQNLNFIRNFNKTGNSVLLIGKYPTEKKAWLLAHLDIISYMVDRPEGDRYVLMPFCYHMMHPGRRTAVALEYDLDQRRLEIVSKGYIITETDGTVAFEPSTPVKLTPGTRICFQSELSWDRPSGKIIGSLDNSAGVAALLLAATFLADYDIELMIGFDDEEEGVSGAGSITIARGAARLLPYFSQPELVISCDFHEAASMLEGGGPQGINIGEGAVFAEKASKGRGEVTPPHVYAFQQQLALELEQEGILLRENFGGYVGRSDGSNAMLRTPNVAVFGYLGENRHFENSASTANLHDLVNLSKAIICYILALCTPAWNSLA